MNEITLRDPSNTLILKFHKTVSFEKLKINRILDSHIWMCPQLPHSPLILQMRQLSSRGVRSLFQSHTAPECQNGNMEELEGPVTLKTVHFPLKHSRAVCMSYSRHYIYNEHSVFSGSSSEFPYSVPLSDYMIFLLINRLYF